MNKALAAAGMVVAAIDFRHSPQYHYPDSVMNVNFALRWLRANASRFNASPHVVGAFGASSGGHLVLLLLDLCEPKMLAGGGRAVR